MKYPVVIVAIVAAVGLMSLSIASAQESGADGADEVFTIVADYDPEDDFDVVQEHRETTATLTATVDGLECATVDIRTPDAVSLRLGEEGQPEQCGRAGAEVILYNIYGNEMFQRFRVEPGATVKMTNYAVAPASTNGPDPAAAGSGGFAASTDESHSRTIAVGLTTLLLVLVAGGLTVLGPRRTTPRGPERS